MVSKGEEKTKSEGYALYSTYDALQGTEKIIKRLLGALHVSQKRQDWASLEKHLARMYPRIHAQFVRVDEEGFETVGETPFDVWRNGKRANPGDSSSGSIERHLAVAAHNIHALTFEDRYRLVNLWTEQIRVELADQVFETVKRADQLRQQLTNIHDDIDRRVLQKADVIGITTTGLAKRMAVLRHVKCKVVICEEAAEVMEPHMISALLPSVEHFIQIGDHEQLRPQIKNYSLSLESEKGAFYQLDRSQFERLSVGGRGMPKFPVAQLNVQRRMRPEISTLIRETVYPRLTDHQSIKSLPDVIGMRKNVFWLDHENFELGSHADKHQKSHSNIWEVEMTHALVRHIVRQGVYNSSDIAVITPYTGQLQKLRSKMRNDFEIVLSERDQDALMKEGFDVDNASSETNPTRGLSTTGVKLLERKKFSDLLRVATVDNFQGEEAKIIIVSLVRSNKERKVGFLRTNNRINVLLSRAQHGMYIIGNSDTYANQPMWARVIGMLQATNSVGNALGLCCPRHVNTVIQVSQPEDFPRFSPEGGCQLACDRRLPDCGHMCQARCHSESMHRIFACPQPCQRLHRPCDHNCQKLTCGEDCGWCEIELDNISLPCGHSKDEVPCYLTQDLNKDKCTVPVTKQVPGCGHNVEVPCSLNVSSPPFSCPVACEANLPCGHLCPGTCGRCHKKDANNAPICRHAVCLKVCGRRFSTCNHTCPRLCHDSKDCGPCLSPCEVSSFQFPRSQISNLP